MASALAPDFGQLSSALDRALGLFGIIRRMASRQKRAEGRQHGSAWPRTALHCSMVTRPHLVPQRTHHEYQCRLLVRDHVADMFRAKAFYETVLGQALTRWTPDAKFSQPEMWPFPWVSDLEPAVPSARWTASNRATAPWSTSTAKIRR